VDLPGPASGGQQLTSAAYDGALHFIPGEKFKSVTKAVAVANERTPCEKPWRKREYPEDNGGTVGRLASLEF